MDTLFLYNTKTLKEKFNTKVFAGDNNITKINVQIPDNIGGYPKRECEYNLRAIISEGNMSYIINPNEPYFYITNDITETAQTVKLMMIITHAGNVIGRTNTVDLIVNEPAEAPDPPLTPREQFDERIAELENENEGLEREVAEQATAIEAKDGQISELNGQVTELEAENAEQAQTITRQNTTIDELNRRVPPLQTLDPINPTTEQVTYNPESPNIGFPQVVVNAPTAERLGFREDYYKKDEIFLNKVGTYAPTYGTTKGGIYIMETVENSLPRKIVFKNWTNPTILSFQDDNNKTKVEEISFYNCPFITTIGTRAFSNYTALSIINFPQNITAINSYAFQNSGDLVSTLTIPDTVVSLETKHTFDGTRFKKIVMPSSINPTVLGQVFLTGSIIEEINIPHGAIQLSPQCFANVTNLKTLFIPNTITSATDGWIDNGGRKLEFVTLENGFNCSLRLSYSTLYSHDTILSWFNALADRTGQTAYTLTIGTTNLNKLTAEEKAIATNKNWNLA